MNSPAQPTRFQAALMGAAITVAFLVCVWLSVDVTYGTNDDAAIMQMIQIGPLAPYVDSTYSSLLHFLYAQVCAGFSWYGASLLAVSALSIATLLGVAIRCYSGLLRGLLMVMVLALNLPSAAAVDYSSVGIVGGATAVIVCLVLALRGALTPLRALLLGLLAMVSMWVRLEGMVATLVFTVPVAVIALLLRLRAGSSGRSVSYSALACFILPLALSVAADRVHKADFSSPEFSAYSQWNDLRGEFHNYPIERENRDNPAVLAATGWSKADYERLTGWFFIDENLYNPRTMSAFFATANRPGIGAYNARYFWWRFQHLITVYWQYWLAMLALWVLFLCGRPTDRLQRMIFLSGPVFVFGFIYVMDALVRYPSRVAVPSMIGFIFAYAFAAIELQWSGEPRVTLGMLLPRRLMSKIPAYLTQPAEFQALMRSLGTLASLAVTACICLFLAWQGFDAQRGSARGVIRYGEIMQHLDEQYTGRYILTQPARGLWTTLQSPLQPFVTKFHPIGVGWETFSPLFYAEIKGLGVDKGYQLPAALVNNKDAFIIGRGDWTDQVVDYLHEHGGMPAARKEAVEHIDAKIYIYRLVSP